MIDWAGPGLINRQWSSAKRHDHITPKTYLLSTSILIIIRPSWNLTLVIHHVSVKIIITPPGNPRCAWITPAVGESKTEGNQTKISHDHRSIDLSSLTSHHREGEGMMEDRSGVIL